MKKSLLLFSLFFMLTGLQQLAAQAAEDIVGAYLENIGGKEKLAAVKTVKMSGNAKAQGMDIPVAMYQKAPGLQRMDIIFQGKTITQMAFDGQEGWSTNFMTMEAEKWDAEQSELMKGEMDFMNAFLDYAAKGYAIALEGEETVEGTDCYKVKLTKKPVTVDGKEEENISFYFFDKESNVPIMTREFAKTGPMKGQPTEVYYSDYQEVNGIYFPFSISQKMAGQTVFSMAVENIELDVDMEDSLFAFPAADAPVDAK